MVAGRPDEALERARADRRQVVGRARAAGRRAAPRARARARRARPRRCRAAARTRRRRSARCPSRAPPSSRRARSGRRRAGRGRRRCVRIVRSTSPGPRGSRRRSTWPLTGRTGTARLGGQRPRAARPCAPAASSDALRPRPRRRRRADAASRARPREQPRHARARGARSPPARSTASASAATSRRGSTEWSPATSSARRTVGASAGSARRAAAGQQALDAQPEARGGTASSRSSSSASSRSRATTSVPRRAVGRVARRDASASSAQKAAKPGRGAQARARAARSSPNSRLGHRREHAGGDVPGAGLAGVEHGHAQARAARRATRSRGRSARRRRRRRRAWHARTDTAADSFPTPARPGSGSTVGGPRAALSARSRAPVSPPMLARAACLTAAPMSPARAHRRRARLYLVCDARAGPARRSSTAALRGGVDMVQLRDKALDDDGLVAARREFRARRRRAGALFILNDRPDLVAACGADGVHVGQDDEAPAAARAAVGPDRIVGRSTHAPEQARGGRRRSRTSTTSRSGRCTPRRPSRAGRPPGSTTSAGRRRTSTKPWFAIGGLDAGDAARGRPRAAPARIVVVRAIAGAADPEAAARALRARLEAPGWRSAAVTPRAGAGRDRRRPRRRPRRGDRAARRCARTPRRDAAARAALRPLAPGERPLALTVAAVLAALLARRQPRAARRRLGGRRAASRRSPASLALRRR